MYTTRAGRGCVRHIFGRCSGVLCVLSLIYILWWLLSATKVKEYMESCSLVGVKYIAEDGRHWTERLLWILLVFLRYLYWKWLITVQQQIKNKCIWTQWESIGLIDWLYKHVPAVKLVSYGWRSALLIKVTITVLFKDDIVLWSNKICNTFLVTLSL